MLALAAWDRHARTLWLARDRVGKKPLYYGWTGDGTFLFGSELAALRACPSLRTDVDPDALALLLRLDYIPAPHCILKGVRKLPAGALVRIDATRTDARSVPDVHRWWNAHARHEAAIDAGFEGDEDAALDALDTVLRDAVALRMEADVPLGAFLSGGTDSSLVTALMQVQSTRPVRSFSSGFDNAVPDESARLPTPVPIYVAYLTAEPTGRVSLPVPLFNPILLNLIGLTRFSGSPGSPELPGAKFQNWRLL